MLSKSALVWAHTQQNTVEGGGRVIKNGVPDGAGTEMGAAVEGQFAKREKRLIQRKPEEQHVGEAEPGETPALWRVTAESKVLAAPQPATLQTQRWPHSTRCVELEGNTQELRSSGLTTCLYSLGPVSPSFQNHLIWEGEWIKI